jgi:hypothetical protein
MSRTRPAALLALLLAAPALAQPVPKINDASLSAIQRGQSAVVTLTGENLAAVSSIALAGDPGVTTELVKDPAPVANQARVKVTVAADALPGDRELRIVGPAGVSNPAALTVSSLPTAAELEPNPADHPQAVTLPVLMQGKIDNPGDVDAFRFEGRKGQHMVFNLIAARTGSPLHALLSLYDSAGRELAASHDSAGADPMLALELPADGAYTLHLRDLEYRGGGNFTYRLEAGPLPMLMGTFPMGGQAGQVVEVQPIGFNFPDGQKIKIDLTGATPGPMPVRATTALGASNEVAFAVSDLPQALEAEPNDSAEKAAVVTLPVVVHGRIDKPGDVDFYRFNLASKAKVNIEIDARRHGSPIDALITLRDASNNVIEKNDDALGADARIIRDLEPGQYTVAVEDIIYGGGPRSTYRLILQPITEMPQGFAVRFLPDTPRLHRGSSTKLWCEVRRDGFGGDVTVELVDLPPGVKCEPVVIAPATSGVFTISAAADAQLGSAPFRFKATGVINGKPVTRIAEPEIAGNAVKQAYLTVLDKAPFAIEPPGPISPQRVAQLAAELKSLEAKLAAPSPQLDAAQAEWEKQASANPAWATLDFTELKSAGGAALAKQPDGSVLLTGGNPDKDIYTLTAATPIKNITAVKLEALADDSLAVKGPGRAANGNFVLHTFALSAAGADGKAADVAFGPSKADFSQQGWDVNGAVDADGATGWAVAPEFGKDHWALFKAKQPFGVDGGTKLTFTLTQQYGQQHTLGRFRISVTTAADPGVGPSLPPQVSAALAVPADQRTAEHKAQLAAYYRSIDPSLAADRARLAALQSVVGPSLELAKLQQDLAASTPQLQAEQEAWEKSIAPWQALEIVSATAEGGVVLTPQPDRSILASGPNPVGTVYTVVVKTTLPTVTAIRLEPLHDDSLPAHGPGRAPDGNFVLSQLALTTDAGANAAPVPVEFAAALADFSQQNFPVAAALQKQVNNRTGWALHPEMAKEHQAIFKLAQPLPEAGAKLLTFKFTHQYPDGPFSLGRFRLAATSQPDPQIGPALPPAIQAITALPAAQRNDAQKAEISAYFRAVAPSLQPLRDRVAALQSAATGGFPPVAARGKAITLNLQVARSPGFAGDVTLSLEGFSSGRDPGSKMPVGIERFIDVKPVALTGGAAAGSMSLTPKGDSEVGPRLVVVRAEAKIGNDTFVQYSPAFPLTVTEK